LFKPNALRYTDNTADKTCHVVGSTTQVGLSQVLATDSGYAQRQAPDLMA
jgi:hypothetical protein